MGSNLIRYTCVSATLFSALMLGREPKTVAQTQDQDVQVIQMTTAKGQAVLLGRTKSNSLT